MKPRKQQAIEVILVATVVIFIFKNNLFLIQGVLVSSVTQCCHAAMLAPSPVHHRTKRPGVLKGVKGLKIENRSEG